MAITVDYSSTPWLITIPKSDLTLQSGTKYLMTVEVFWSLLRDYSDSFESMPNPIIYRRIAATASTPSITEVDLAYYRLQFEDGLYSVDIIDGNTNIRDAEVKNQVSVNTNNTTGFINPTFIEAGLFNGEVAISILNGVPLTASGKTPSGDIIGTEGTPANSILDMHTISIDRGLKSFVILDSMTLTGSHDFSEGHKFRGFSPVIVSVSIDTSIDVANCEFSDMQISGILDGNSVFREAVVGTVNYINGFIYNSALAGTITLGGNANASIQGCWQQVKSNIVTIDMGGSGQQLALTDYQGDVVLTNCTGAGNTFVSGRGKVTLDSTITSGTFTVYGDMEIENNMTGTAVLNNKTSSELTWLNVKALQFSKWFGLK